VNVNGLVLILVGVWIVVQVIGGDALGRLRVLT